jgi:hypothetical protein
MPRGSVAGSADHNAGTVFRHWSIAASYGCRESAKNVASAAAPWSARWALAVPIHYGTSVSVRAAASSGSPSLLRTRSAHARADPFQGYDCPNADLTR